MNHGNLVCSNHGNQQLLLDYMLSVETERERIFQLRPLE